MTLHLPDVVAIRDVGPRDGLQGEDPVSVADRIWLIDALVDTGLREVEAVAFVSPTAVPAMAGAGDVLAGVTRRSPVVLAALVPNVKGAELAMAAGVDQITFTMSASAEYNRRNVNMEPDESVEALRGIHATVGEVPVDAVISCAFGSPYEGDVSPGTVARLVDAAIEAGATSVTLADTTGVATPRRIDDVLKETGPMVGLHLHETRRTALVNAYAALQAGVRRFDTSIGGLGGSPFAAGAAGNLATEDFVHLLADCGVHTGVDLVALLAITVRLADILGHPVPSAIAAAGPRTTLG